MIPLSAIATYLLQYLPKFKFTAKPKRFLVVEDDAATANLLELHFKHLEHDCDICETAEEALGRMASQKYDIVFIDLRLPGMNGIGLIERVLDETESVCVITPTHIDDLHLLKTSTFVSLIVKPVTQAALKKAIDVLGK